MLIAGGRSSVAWATTKALVRRRDTVLGSHTVPRRPVGAENRVTSCDLQVLVDEAAEPVPSEHADGVPGFWRGVACGRVLVQ
jgi:hypothetical protein